MYFLINLTVCDFTLTPLNILLDSLFQLLRMSTWICAEYMRVSLRKGNLFIISILARNLRYVYLDWCFLLAFLEQVLWIVCKMFVPFLCCAWWLLLILVEYRKNFVLEEKLTCIWSWCTPLFHPSSTIRILLIAFLSSNSRLEWIFAIAPGVLFFYWLIFHQYSVVHSSSFFEFPS